MNAPTAEARLDTYVREMPLHRTTRIDDREAWLLMARIRQQDIDAFEVLYDAFHRRVYAIGLRILGDVHSAEDLTQTVFLKVWNSPRSFAPGSFAAWICRVTRNAAIDLLRERRHHREYELSDGIASQSPIDDPVDRWVDVDYVRSAMFLLPENQRELIDLAFFGGMTYEELARSRRLPLGTVKSRIRNGLRALQSRLSVPQLTTHTHAPTG